MVPCVLARAGPPGQCWQPVHLLVWPESAGVLLLQSHAKLVEGVVDLVQRVQADRQLTNLIRRKFAIKCTTGEGPGRRAGVCWRLSAAMLRKAEDR